MTDEELKAGVQKIQTLLAETMQKLRSQKLRGILADISDWTEKTAEHLIRTPGENFSKETKMNVFIFLHYAYFIEAKDATRSKPLRNLFDTLFREHVSLFCRYINEKMEPAQ